MDLSLELCSKDTKDKISYRKNETAPKFDLDEAKIFSSKSTSDKMKPKESKTKRIRL